MPHSSSSSTSSASEASSSSSSSVATVTTEQKDKLLNLLKKEVKHIMEEAVMLKAIHEDSSTVTSLAAVVEACLSMGLKRRALGLFKTSSTMALLQKISRDNADAEAVLKRVAEVEAAMAAQRRDVTSVIRLSRSGTLEKVQSTSQLHSNSGCLSTPSVAALRFLWIRLALFEKRLSRIVCYLVQECDKYYTRDSLISDTDYGPILSSLLAGPCALEYTKIKAQFTSWTDLPANELVQRHKISCGSVSSSQGSFGSLSGVATAGANNNAAAAVSATNSPQHQPPSYRRSLSHAVSVSGAAASCSDEVRSAPSQAREYVESLHQNSRDAILYGKNNVQMVPKNCTSPVLGYLSLHQTQTQTQSLSSSPTASTTQQLCLKWTPNRLMSADAGEEKASGASWQQAVVIDMASVLFMHCHQDQDESGTLTLVSTDGTQHAPIQFPAGGHMALFLSCLESSLSAEGGSLRPTLGDAATDAGSEAAIAAAANAEAKPKEAAKPRRLLPLLRRRRESASDSPCDSPGTAEGTTPSSGCPSPSILGMGSPAATRTPTDTVFRLVLSSTASAGSAASAPIDQPLKPLSASSSLGLTSRPRLACSHMLRTERGSTSSLPTPNQLSKTKTDWWMNIFSPSKSRHNSTASTETSRSFSLNSDGASGAATDSLALNEEDEDEILTCATVATDADKADEADHGEDEDDEEAVRDKRASPSEPLNTVCTSMKRQIIARAFYGWLSHCRHLRTVRKHLTGLTLDQRLEVPPAAWRAGVTATWWREQCQRLRIGQDEGLEGLVVDEDGDKRSAAVEDMNKELIMRVFLGGVEPALRKELWPYLLGHYPSFGLSKSDLESVDRQTHAGYEARLSDWMAVEAIVRQRDKENTAASIAKASQGVSVSLENVSLHASLNMSNEVFESMEEPMSSRTCSADKISTITEVTENENSEGHSGRAKLLSTQSEPAGTSTASVSDEDQPGLRARRNPSPRDMLPSDEGIDVFAAENSHVNGSVSDKPCNGIATDVDVDVAKAISALEKRDNHVSYKITTPSVDSGNADSSTTPCENEAGDFTEGVADFSQQHIEDIKQITKKISTLAVMREDTLSSASSCHSSDGGGYSPELVENFALNLHRIDKDVQRCDRNLAYFTLPNLEKLRNVITTYVWENLEVGYMQGMCDLVAPLLVTFDDEALTHSCFSRLMERMIGNFPNGNQMDDNFANMRSLIQVLDQTLYDSIQQSGDFSHFYFCYRWFLLDFKREFAYHEVYLVWETIWASRQVVSAHFHLFVAMALVETYRDIILDRNMDFTDIIKFFNEMAERHDAREILQVARELVTRLQSMIVDD